MVSHHDKAQRAGAEIRAAAPLVRKSRQSPDGVKNVPDDPVGGVDVVFGEEFPDVSDRWKGVGG